MAFAGTPPTTVFGGTSFVTTAPAATIAPSPTETPGRMVAWEPVSYTHLLGEHSHSGTAGVMAGFILMMILDVALG